MNEKRFRYVSAAPALLFAMIGFGHAEPPAKATNGVVAPPDYPQYTLGEVISAQGNEALREIRKGPILLSLPDLSQVAVTKTSSTVANTDDKTDDEAMMVNIRPNIASARREMHGPRLQDAAVLRRAPE